MIQRALDKRQSGVSKLGSPQAMAKNMAETISKQLGLTQDRIRGMTRDMVAKLVMQKEPGYSEAQVREAVEFFMNPPRPKSQAQGVGPEVLASMIADFVEYSQARMTPTRQLELREQLGSNWPESFFKKFPGNIRLLIKDHLEGKVGSGEFWEIVEEILGLQ
jgi:hypothetical protein